MYNMRAGTALHENELTSHKHPKDARDLESATYLLEDENDVGQLLNLEISKTSMNL